MIIMLGFASCLLLIIGLAYWCWRLSMELKAWEGKLTALATLTKQNTLFIDGVKSTAQKMNEASKKKISELQSRLPR